MDAKCGFVEKPVDIIEQMSYNVFENKRVEILSFGITFNKALSV